MGGLFSAYRVALVDSSFYFRPFSSELRSALKEIKVYVGHTFRDETDQISKVLSKNRRPVYEENRSFLSHEIKLNYVQMVEGDERSDHLQNDTWGLLNLMSGIGAKFVLVTADRLLIDRVILADKKVDIYDLSTESFRFYESFASCRAGFALDTRMKPVTDDYEPIREGRTLYRKNGSAITLANEINSGIEGNLYRLHETSDLIAKIFKKGKLPENKLASLMKLQGINEVMEISWAIFPRDILYFDKELTIPVGFTESYIETASNLGEDPLYLGNVLELPDEQLDLPISQTLRLVLKIVRQVRYLNQYGFYISDYNPMNFSFRSDDYELMQMWDTDSFSYERFFSGFIAGDKTSREYDVTKKLGTIDFCNEALYIFAFKMLTLGDAPISELRGTFKYDKESYPNLFRKNMIPSNLWKLFDDVFHGKKEASTEALLRELVVATDELGRNPSQDKTYLRVINEVFGEDEEPAAKPEYKPEYKPEKEPEKPQEKMLPTGQDLGKSNIPPQYSDSVSNVGILVSENGGYKPVDLQWGTPQKKNKKKDPVKMSLCWIAGVLCVAALCLAYFLLR